MVEIVYLNSQSGLANCFEYYFYLKEYIPNKYFEAEEDEAGAELYYFIDLLKQNNMFDCKKEHYHELIWSCHYDCVYNGTIPFTMVYNEDYDMVSFAVSEEYLDFKETIAEKIQSLITANKPMIKDLF